MDRILLFIQTDCTSITNCILYTPDIVLNLCSLEHPNHHAVYELSSHWCADTKCAHFTLCPINCGTSISKTCKPKHTNMTLILPCFIWILSFEFICTRHLSYYIRCHKCVHKDSPLLQCVRWTRSSFQSFFWQSGDKSINLEIQSLLSYYF